MNGTREARRAYEQRRKARDFAGYSQSLRARKEVRQRVDESVWIRVIEGRNPWIPRYPFNRPSIIQRTGVWP